MLASEPGHEVPAAIEFDQVGAAPQASPEEGTIGRAVDGAPSEDNGAVGAYGNRPEGRLAGENRAGRNIRNRGGLAAGGEYQDEEHAEGG